MSPRWWEVPGPGDEQAPAELEELVCSCCGGDGHVLRAGYQCVGDGSREEWCEETAQCPACEGTGDGEVERRIIEAAEGARVRLARFALDCDEMPEWAR